MPTNEFAGQVQRGPRLSHAGNAPTASRAAPAVAGWFRSRFPGGPTGAQARAWAVTFQHRNALIAAPTGSGKTLVAFLSAIN